MKINMIKEKKTSKTLKHLFIGDILMFPAVSALILMLGVIINSYVLIFFAAVWHIFLIGYNWVDLTAINIVENIKKAKE